MLADEVMTADVVTVSRDAAVSEIAALPLESRISAVPAVEDGNVRLWGMAESDAQIRALEVAVAEIRGFAAVENHVNRIEPRMFFGE